jgi:transposase
MCSSFRIIEWIREEVETSDEKARERVQSVVLDMSSQYKLQNTNNFTIF